MRNHLKIGQVLFFVYLFLFILIDGDIAGWYNMSIKPQNISKINVHNADVWHDNERKWLL